jgi:hypothetical protein
MKQSKNISNSSTPIISSGTWTPIITNLINLASPTVKFANYLKINNNVFITLQFNDCPAVVGGINTGFSFSLPFIATNLSSFGGGKGIG